MKWVKHDTAANRDAKLQKVRMKYGLEGYGLYWYCIELIAEGIDEHNLTFELEHDAEIIAFNTGVHHERVEEMMTYMVKLGLFENYDGVITCYKLAKRLDQSSTSNAHMRKIIAEMKSNPDIVMTLSGRNHDGVLMESDQSRLDKSREDKKEKKTPSPKKHPLPEDFEITEKMRSWFEKQNFTIEIEKTTDRWKDSMLADSQKYQRTDWVAAWRNGMNKAQEWADEKNPSRNIPNKNPMPKAGTEQ